jgi:hypothetical protein
MSEEDRIAVALFGERAQLDPRSLLGLPASDADREAAAPQGNGNSSRIDGPIMMGPSQTLDDVLRKVQSRRVQMTAIRCDGSIDEQIPVPPAGLNDLIFRLSPDHRAAPVGLLVAIARYPDLEIAAVFACECDSRMADTKTAAVCGAIPRHRREIMAPEAPLAKLEARQRCQAEVPNAYPGAFKKAWAELEPSCKRERGKHGPSGH